MASYSVREAVVFSLSAYKKHFLVLLIAGSSVMGTNILISRIPTGDEYILKLNDKPEQNIKVPAMTSRNALLALMYLVFYLLSMYLGLGCMKLALSVKDTDSASLSALFIGWPLIVFSIKIGFIVSLYWAAGLLVNFFIIHVGAYFFHIPIENIGLFFRFFLFLALFCWGIRFVFLPFIFIDNPSIGIRNAITLSAQLVHNHRLKIIGGILSLVLIQIMAMVLMFIYCRIFAVSTGVIDLIIGSVLGGGGVVCSLLCLAYAYRALNKQLRFY